MTRIAAAVHIDASYSPGGANGHSPAAHANLLPNSISVGLSVFAGFAIVCPTYRLMTGYACTDAAFAVC